MYFAYSTKKTNGNRCIGIGFEKLSEPRYGFTENIIYRIYKNKKFHGLYYYNKEKQKFVKTKGTFLDELNQFFFKS